MSRGQHRKRFGRLGLGLLFALALAACSQSVAPTTPTNPTEPVGPETPPPPTPTAPTPPIATTLRWSDAATWNGQLPLAGDKVTIPADKAVLLDVSPPPLSGLTVDGTLVFDEQDLSLTVDWLVVHGELRIGTREEPFAHRATITLTGTPEQDVMGMGSKVLGLMGGTLRLHGQERVSWTRLAATAEGGASSLTLEDTPDWQAGERIVVASTDFDFEQAEERVITGVSGNTVRFSPPLKFAHWGEVQTFGAYEVDERAEVGLLSRNIVVQGDERSDRDGFGGNLKVMMGGKAEISGVEFERMGQRGVMGRYPIHFHMQGDSAGSYVRGSSVHHAYNRCLTVHGAHNIVIEDNVAFDTYGHCYFLEDGAEQGNLFRRNLGLVTRKPTEDDALLDSDRTFPGPATFWITHPDNTFLNNVAAGSQGSGFWFALPEHPTGPSTDTTIWPRRTPLAGFAGNVAHSNGADGLHVDRGPKADGSTESTSYAAHKDPSDEKSARVTSTFTDFTAYKNRNEGAWLRGRDLVLENATLADNARGVTFAAREGWLTDSLVVGETANLGTPPSYETTGEGGRSLPQPWNADFNLRGFEFYDGRVGVTDTHFVNFQPNDQRQASALSYLNYTAFHVDPGNFASGLSFEDAQAVYLASRGLPTDTERGEDGYRSALFYDEDGSVTGQAGRYVVVNNPFLQTEMCQRRAAWNALVCAERYVSLTFENRDALDIGTLSVTRADGVSHAMLGTPKEGANTHFRSSVLARGRYQYSSSEGTPRRARLHLNGSQAGDWLYVSLPYTHSEVFVYRDWWIDKRNLSARANSMGELEASSGAAYYLADGTLHLKMQVQAERDWAVLDVCQQAGCP